MALPRSEPVASEVKPPCSLCGKPGQFSGYWGKRLCEPCAHAWMAAMDAEFVRLGNKYPSDPGDFFGRWFADQKVRAA